MQRLIIIDWFCHTIQITESESMWPKSLGFMLFFLFCFKYVYNFDQLSQYFTPCAGSMCYLSKYVVFKINFIFSNKPAKKQMCVREEKMSKLQDAMWPTEQSLCVLQPSADERQRVNPRPAEAEAEAEPHLLWNQNPAVKFSFSELLHEDLNVLFRTHLVPSFNL